MSKRKKGSKNKGIEMKLDCDERHRKYKHICAGTDDVGCILIHSKFENILSDST